MRDMLYFEQKVISEKMVIREILKYHKYLNLLNNFTGVIEYPNGTRCWYRDGKLHRDLGPAIINKGYYIISCNQKKYCLRGGEEVWYQKGKLHRGDGPAYIDSVGNKEWFYNGDKVSSMDIFDKLTDEQKEKEIWNLDQWK